MDDRRIDESLIAGTTTPKHDVHSCPWRCLHTMGRSCKDIAESLRDCLLKTECMKRPGTTMKDCLDEEQSPQCQVLRNTYFECKRSQLDMRTRIRGQKAY